MCITQAPRRVARGQVIHCLVSQARHLHIEQRHIDMLSHTGLVTMGEGGQDRYGRVQPRQDVGERNAHLHRPCTFFTVRAPSQAHQPTQPLNHEVIARALGIRPGLPEARDRAIDERGVERFQARIVQPIGCQPAHLEVFDDDVRLGSQFAYEALPLWLSEVDGHRALVAVGRQIVSRLAGVLALRILKEGRPP